MEACIYCSTVFDSSKGQGDHIIPAALGEFENDVRFRRICPQCNQRIGQSEQVLLHCGPESMLRRKVNPARPAFRNRGRTPVRAAMGSKGPTYSVPFGDYPLLVRPSETVLNRVETVDQLAIQDANKQWHHIRLFPNMRKEQLQKQIDQIVSKPLGDIRLDADPIRWDGYFALMRLVWPNAKLHEVPRYKSGDEEDAECDIKFAVNEHYFRAIAKIAFHGYLVRSQRNLRGNEPGFAAIRRFIMAGTKSDVDKFCLGSHAISFIEPFGLQKNGKTKFPKHYSHFLASDETEQTVVGYVHLFLGPGCLTKAYHILLGTHASEIIGGTSFVHAHFYEYDELQSETGTAGKVREALVEIQGPRRLITGRLKT